jgi:CheY-like chemotaxis protein
MAKGQILVVDDNPNLLELIRLRLESADYEVTAIADEAEAVNAIKEKIFDQLGK